MILGFTTTNRVPMAASKYIVREFILLSDERSDGDIFISTGENDGKQIVRSRPVKPNVIIQVDEEILLDNRALYINGRYSGSIVLIGVGLD
jgi:hypothetical protein